MIELALLLAGFVAGAINAVAGGGPVLTLAAMTAFGIDPRIANLTSTVALSPGQLVAGWAARRDLAKLRAVGHAPPIVLIVALSGGAIGAALLLGTEASTFRRAVPWLVLLATVLYMWSSRGGTRPSARGLHPAAFLAASFISGIYGGYFGGGNSFVILALLAVAGLGGTIGGNIKNVLVAAINFGAVVVLAFSGSVDWSHAAALGAGGIAGSLAGVRLLARLDARVLRYLVIASGLGLAAWFFVR